MYEDVQLSASRTKTKKTLNFKEAAADLIVRMHADDHEATLAKVTAEKFTYQNKSLYLASLIADYIIISLCVDNLFDDLLQFYNTHKTRCVRAASFSIGE